MKRVLAACSSIMVTITAALSAPLSPQTETTAAELLFSGRNAQAEYMAERVLRSTEADCGPDSRALLQPLQLLVSARLEQGKTRMAWRAFQRMQAIPIRLPEDHAILHGTAAALLHIEGKTGEAVTECLKTIAALTEAGRENTTDAASVLNTIAALYIDQHRFHEASAALERALVIFTSSTDAVPLDRIKLLHLRAAVYVRTGDWSKALDDMKQAVSLASQNPDFDPGFRTRLLDDYAKLLRKSHQGRQARSLEARVAELRSSSVPNAVVDVTELAGRRK